MFNCLDHRYIEACRAAVSEQAVAEFRARAFGDPALPIVAYAGRPRHDKELHLLAGALGRLNANGLRAGLLVIGGGPALAELRDTTKRLRVPAHFAGPIYDEQDSAVELSAARVVAVPGAVGLAAVHAMSYGTPVATHDDVDGQHPEVEAIVPRATGELFRRGTSRISRTSCRGSWAAAATAARGQRTASR